MTDKVNPWSYKEFEGRAVDVAGKLAEAMIANPHLAVFVAMGRYDGGVPVEAITFSLDQMSIAATARARIETHTYPAGHMMHVPEPSRLVLSDDLAAFIRRTSGTR